MLVIWIWVDGWIMVGKGDGVGVARKMRVVVCGEMAGGADSGVVGETRLV